MQLLPHATLVPPDPAASLLVASATAKQAAVALWAVGQDPATWLVTVQQRGVVQQTVEVPAHVDWEEPLVQAMPDGAVLIANSTSVWEDGASPQPNAEIVDAFGVARVRGTLGDGINRLLTTSTGDIWVGYTDEGIYGNRGWGEPGRPAIGESGLVRFDARLEPTWSYHPSRRGQFVISECYALNVTDAAVYANIYDGDAILRVVDGVVRAWPSDFFGATALVVAGETFALVGGYDGERQRMDIGSLAGTRATVSSTSTLPRYPEERARPPHVACRGRILHVFDDLAWHRATLDPR